MTKISYKKFPLTYGLGFSYLAFIMLLLVFLGSWLPHPSEFFKALNEPADPKDNWEVLAGASFTIALIFGIPLLRNLVAKKTGYFLSLGWDWFSLRDWHAFKKPKLTNRYNFKKYI
jgi:hypothetical protein